jgi:hypothetical protein
MVRLAAVCRLIHCEHQKRAHVSSTCPGRHTLKCVLTYSGHLAHSLQCSVLISVSEHDFKIHSALGALPCHRPLAKAAWRRATEVEAKLPQCIALIAVNLPYVSSSSFGAAVLSTPARSRAQCRQPDDARDQACAHYSFSSRRVASRVKLTPGDAH